VEAERLAAAMPDEAKQALASEMLGLVRLLRGEDAGAAAELGRAFGFFSRVGYEHETRWLL
jgi:hypothetical protein